MFAIAAMAKNRVIGNGSAIPWRIPEEFKWFRRKTLGGVVIMGRRTFESLPKPLDGRVNVVLTRSPARLVSDERFRERYGDAVVGAAAHRPADVTQLALPKFPSADVRLVRGIDTLKRAGLTESAWLCGGAQLYAQFLKECSELYLSVIDREVEGDVLFPAFEDLFDARGVIAEFAEFKVHHYVRNDVDRQDEAPAPRTGTEPPGTARPGSTRGTPEPRGSTQGAGVLAPPKAQLKLLG